ncbi:MAG: iron-sulfur cluster repair di-iron protein [Bacteroidetes bacterium]|nr:iron-sulfur cluster repair di-iron protein [Bacteroidota bacterium]
MNIKIDVTKIMPRRKHPAIFEAFDALSAGDSVIIHNDHDPKPVYYQLIGTRGHCFTWSYLSSGPEVWEVEVRKNESTHNGATIGSIVTKDIRKAEVFKKLGIDFCCGGKKTLEQACKEKGLEESDVLLALENTNNNTGNTHDFDKWKISFLADYIINQHHTYVRDSTPLLSELSMKVSSMHGDKNPELININEKLGLLLKELATHMKKEEAILFPYIKKLEDNICNEVKFNNIQEAVWVMERDHDVAGDLMREIRELSNNYTTPVNACNSYKLLYYKLEEFENDLHRHVHLENNILFPKSIEIENNA